MVGVRESWEEENAAALREVDALLERVAAGEVEQFEGAFGAYRILQNGTTLISVEEERSAVEEHHAGSGDKLARLQVFYYLRMALSHMVDQWANRPAVRDRVERDVVDLAEAWSAHQRGGAGVDWPAWRRWWDPHASPFGDEGNGSGVAEVTRRELPDLRELPRRVRAEHLYLTDCTVASLDGIERFAQVGTLMLHDVEGLRDLSAIERLPHLTSLTLSAEDHLPDPRLVGTIDFARLSALTHLSLQCLSEELLEPIPVDTSWIPRAPYLMHLVLDGFVPASGTFEDIVAAPRLINLRLTARDARELDPVFAALPLTHISMHHLPSAAPRPGDFGMATAEGNRAVASLLDTIKTWLRTTARPTSDDLNQRLADGIAAIADAGHSEVFDTAVRDDMYVALRHAIKAAGIDADGIDFG
jgi:hypothetical protein